MRAAVLTDVCVMGMQDVPEPSCGAGELLLQVDVCAICGTDLKFFEFGNRKVKPPVVLGHEIAGTVLELGAGVVGYARGDRVVLSPSGGGCGACYYCGIGRDELCDSYRGMFGKGGFAERVVVPASMVARGNVFHIPDSLSSRAAALVEPIACVLNSHDYLDLKRGEAVVILGAGPIGIMHAYLCKAAGSEPLFITDVDDARLAAIPEGLGAIAVNGAREDVEAVVKAATGGLGAAAVIVAAPVPVAQQQALHIVRKTGTVCYFAGLPVGTKEVAIDTNKIHYDQIRVFGTSNCNVEHSRRALAMIVAGTVDAEAIVTHSFPLEETVEAFAFAAGRSGLKVAVVPESRSEGQSTRA